MEAQRAAGNGQLADMLAKANIVPGAGIDFVELSRLILILIDLVLYLVASTLMWLQGYLLNALVMRVVFKLREDIERKLNRLPLGYFDTRQRGDLMSRVTNGVDSIQAALQQAFSQLVQSALTLIGTRSQKLFAARWKHTGSLNGHIEETFSGLELVRAYGREEEMLAEFDERNQHLFKASFGAQFVSGMIMPAMQFVSYLSYVLVAVVGGVRVVTGQMTLGDATVFIQYSREFSQPIGEMAGIANMIQSGVA